MTETQKQKYSPFTWVPSAYFAMGMPFVVLNMVCVLMFSGLGIDDSQIALWTSIIMFPWTIKFLWSPFLEIFKTKKFFVVATQLISMAELSKTDQAKFIGWQGAFYNIAKLIATGGLVYIAGAIKEHFASGDYVKAWYTTEEAYLPAWTIIMLSCCAILVVLSLWHRIVLPSSAEQSEGEDKKSISAIGTELVEMIKDFFTKKHIWIYIAFIILYRLGEGFVMKIVPLFLKADRADGGLGLSEQQIGLYYGSFGAAAFVLGSLLAGYYIAHRGLKKSLFSLVCIFNIPFLIYTYFAWAQPESILFIGTGLALEYFGYGFGFVGLTLFMMQQVAPGKHQMAHYAFASGIMNLSVMITGMPSGFLSDALGYKIFFTVIMIAVIPVFIMTKFLPFTYPDNAAKSDN